MVEPVKTTGTVRRTGFRNFDNSISDHLTCIAFNDLGDKMALGSANHKIQVYEEQALRWKLFDVWGGHDAEVYNVKWLSCGQGNYLASIGADSKFKLWQKDHAHARTRGRRFKCIYSQSPLDSVAFVAFDFAIKRHDPYLALLSHTGLLSIMEPTDTKFLHAWKEVDNLHPFGQQRRGCEPRYGLSFRPEVDPIRDTATNNQNLNFMSLAVSYLCAFKIYHVCKTEKHNYIMQEVCSMGTDGVAIPSLEWQPLSGRPGELLALGCEDGTTRIVRIDIQMPISNMVTSSDQPTKLGQRRESGSFETDEKPAGGGHTRDARTSMSTESPQYTGEEIAMLPHFDRATVTKVKWTLDGNALITNDSNNVTRMWKQTIKRNWIEYAELGPS